MTRIKKVLAACCLANGDVAVLGCAAAMAEKHDAELHLVHVLPKLGKGMSAQDETRRARERLESLLPADQVLKLSVRWEVRQGRVATALLDYARESGVNLIVMGSHPRTGLMRMVATSRPAEVLKSAPCPVVIVPLISTANAITLAQLAGTLRDEFGEAVAGDRATARVQMRELLERRFNLSAEQADEGLRRLETAEVLVWGPSPGGMQTSSGRAWLIQPQMMEAGAEEPALASSTPVPAPTPATDLLHRALALRATDIHLDPTRRDAYKVRMRIDGRLEHYCDLDAELAAHLLQQFKVLANLDIADPFKPQEGRMRLDDPTLDCQIRITTSPVQGGQSVCLRLQTHDTILRPLSELGMASDTHAAVTRLLRRGEGLVLVTGPTGAGKTTMIYSMLRELESHEHHRNVVTIEDPVEFNVPFLRQMNVHEAHGMSLETGLRVMLRMDPDVIFVGEVRDGDTAALAMRAASSGKYVFSTLHTRDVASTVTALRDLGVASASLAGNLTGMISQRLVRRLCVHCRELRDITEAERQVLAEHQLESPTMVYRPHGCEHCRQAGYIGRIGVFEVVVAEDQIAEQISRNGTEEDLRRTIRSSGVPSLKMDGLRKALAGVTSLEEVTRMRWV